MKLTDYELSEQIRVDAFVVAAMALVFARDPATALQSDYVDEVQELAKDCFIASLVIADEVRESRNFNS